MIVTIIIITIITIIVQPLTVPINPGKACRGKSRRRLFRFQPGGEVGAGDEVVLQHVLEERLEGREDDRLAEDAGVQLVRGVSVGEQREGAGEGLVAHGAGQQVGGRQRGGGEGGHGGEGGGGEGLRQHGRRVVGCSMACKA